MLKSALRLRTPEVREVLARKTFQVSTSFFNMIVKEDKGANTPARFAVVVSGKVASSAVIRHNIRRRMYEAIRQTHDRFPLGIKVICMMKHPALKASSKELVNAVLEAVR